jgi:hypothetical protein
MLLLPRCEVTISICYKDETSEFHRLHVCRFVNCHCFLINKEMYVEVELLI